MSDPTDCDSLLRSHLAAATPPAASTPTRTQTFCAFTGPAIDAAAGGFSLAASRLAANPLAEKISGVIGGGLWLAGTIANEIGNAPRSRLVSSANFFCGVTDAVSIAAPFVLGHNQRSVGYSSAASWVANGAADIVCAAGNPRRNIASRLLQGTGGVANIAAAGLSAASVDASARTHGVKAANLGTVSSALWIVGAAASLGAEWVARSSKFQPAPAGPGPGQRRVSP